MGYYTEEQAIKAVELLKTNKYTDKEIAKMTNTDARNFVAKIRRKETWKQLTCDYDGPLGKADRPTTFNKRSSTTIS